MIKLHLHPDYLANKNKWQEYQDLYDGDHEVLVNNGYLWRHMIEGADEKTATPAGRALWKIRQLRSQYTNLIEPIVSTYVSLFFKQDPNYAEIESVISKTDRENIDGKGKSFTQFIKEDVLINYLIFGKPLIFTDTPNKVAVTEKDSKELGLRPYFEILNPLSVVDWQIKAGKYDFIRFEYYIDKERESVEDEPSKIKEAKVLYLKSGKYSVKIYQNKSKNAQEEWVVKSDAVIKNGTGETYNRLPIATLFDQKSWIKDLAGLAKAIFNADSSIDTALNNQGYKRTWIAGDNISADEWMKMGEGVLNKLPKDSTLLESDPVDTGSMEKRRAELIIALFRTAFNTARVMSSESQAVEGDQTLKERKSDLINLIKSSIKEIEDVVNAAVQDWAMLAGKELKGKVKLSQDVDEDDIDLVIKIFLQHQSYITKYAKWTKAYLKRILKSQELEESEEIMQEIEADENLVVDPLLDPANQKTPLKEKIKQAANG